MPFMAAFFVLFAASNAGAVNISIYGTPKVELEDNDNTKAWIIFDIAWDNSWRTPKPDNYDAAWIFAKCWDGSLWRHVYMPTDREYIAGDPSHDDYYVSNLDGSNLKSAMEIEQGKEHVYPKWNNISGETRATMTVGVFLKRAGYGTGDINVPGVKLPWNPEAQGLTLDFDLIIRVFALEMVYVPQGAYQLGAATGSDQDRNRFAFTCNGTTVGSPYNVTSENRILMNTGATPSNGYLSTGGGNGMSSGQYLRDEFPKGFRAFYIMKYELTQGAYTGYLNTLSIYQVDGSINRPPLTNLEVGSNVMWLGNSGHWSPASPYFFTKGDVHDGRQSIILKNTPPYFEFGVDGNQNGIPDEVGSVETQTGPTQPKSKHFQDGQNVALTHARFTFCCNFADWACLRPMTELEYEKACRGPLLARIDEFAWGSHIMLDMHLVRNNLTWNNWSTGAYGYNTLYGSNSRDGRFLNIGLANEMTNKPEGTTDKYLMHNSAVSLAVLSRGTGSYTNATYWWAGPPTKVPEGETCGTPNNQGANQDISTMFFPEPVRVGMLANQSTNRMSSGATYWGVMNMSDNAREPVMNVWTSYNFYGAHGDGELQGNGMSNVSYVPTAETTTGTGNAWNIFTNTNMTAYNNTWTIAYYRGIKYDYFVSRSMNYEVGQNPKSWWAGGTQEYYCGNQYPSYTMFNHPAWSKYVYTDDNPNRGFIAARHDSNLGTTDCHINSLTAASEDQFQGIRCVRTQAIDGGTGTLAYPPY